MRHAFSIPLGALVVVIIASYVPAQGKQSTTARPVAQGKDKEATDKRRLTFHVVGMKKSKSGAT